MKKFRKYMKQNNYENINEIEAQKYYDILMKYILVDFKFIKSNKIDVFKEYVYCMILERMGYFRHNEEKSDMFKNKYVRIQNRINVSIDELRYKEEKDFDYENEVLVIAFRIMNYLELYENRLCLKVEDAVQTQIRIYNDYRSNVYICEVQEKDIDYASLKLIEEKINDLRKEIEYLNDFILNYYQEYYLQIFRISKIVFDKENIAKNFIQGEVKFTASFKIIQKLIGPLYLNKESYGMRELIQNAVDACLKKENSKGQIDIRYFSKENPCIKIKDNGIGMNEDIIINKFLTIGESAKEDDKSIGKFGIGILAVFLIADKMKFKTCYQGEKYFYESEEIELEAVQDEEKFINIEKHENIENFQGTEIVFTLKKSILGNGYVKNIQDKIQNEHNIVIKNLFGLSNTVGSMWYGFGDELKKMKGEIGINSTILNEKLEIIEELIHKIESYEVSKEHGEGKKEGLEKNIKENCKKALKGIERKRHLEAYSVFEYLSVNKWYLLNDDSLAIEFYDNNTKLTDLPNLHQEDIINENDVLKTIQNNSSECKIQYFWSKEYAGNVFCNNMLIPSKYKYESCLAKAFQLLPTILVYESEKQKIEIDLARESCKLEIKGTNYEEQLLKEILINCLQSLDSSKEYLQPISWLYFINEKGELKKVVKNKVWIYEHKEMEYYMVYLKNQEDKENSDKDKIKIVEELVKNCNKKIIIEFVNDMLHIDTTFNNIKQNDLYVAANNRINLVLRKETYEKITGFSTAHLKALALAAENIYGNVCVSTDNQLKLNTNDLRIYMDNNEYKKMFKIINEEISYLNYAKESENLLKSLPQNVEAIMQMKITMYDYYNIFKLFEDIAKIKESRSAVWNGFQEALHKIELSEDDELRNVLMKEYEISEE